MTYPCICIRCNITGGKKPRKWQICHFCWNQNDKTTDVFKTTSLILLSCEVIQTSSTFWFYYWQMKASNSPITPFKWGIFWFPSESRNSFLVVGWVFLFFFVWVFFLVGSFRATGQPSDKFHTYTKHSSMSTLLSGAAVWNPNPQDYSSTFSSTYLCKYFPTWLYFNLKTTLSHYFKPMVHWHGNLW